MAWSSGAGPVTRRHYRYRPRVYARVPGVGCVGCSALWAVVLLALILLWMGLA